MTTRMIGSAYGLWILLMAFVLQGCGQSPAGNYSLDVDATISANPEVVENPGLAVLLRAAMSSTTVDLEIRDDGTFSLIRTKEGRPRIENGTWVNVEGGLLLTGDDGESVPLILGEGTAILKVPDGGGMVFQRVAD